MRNIVATVKVRLNDKSETPLSITIHWAKYKKKTIEMSEFAKSYRAQRKMFLAVCMPNIIHPKLEIFGATPTVRGQALQQSPEPRMEDTSQL